MLPEGALSTNAIVAAATDPVKMPGDFLIDWERGGVALGDSSQGLRLKVWTLEVTRNEDVWDVTVKSQGVTKQLLFSGPDITEASLAFDQNMRPFVAYVQDGVCKFRWYDPNVAGIITSDLPEGCRTPRCCVDEKRQTHLDISDILFAYIRAGNLCIRYQRERYQIEHVLKAVGFDAELVSICMNKANRVQFRLRKVSIFDDQAVLKTSPYLADIVGDLCKRAGIDQRNVNLSELYEDEITGYKVNSNDDVSKQMSPILDAFFVDCVEHDKKLHFYKRGRDVVARISYRDLVDDEPEAFNTTRIEEKDLPREVNVNHVDPAGGFAKNKQTITRKSNLIAAKAKTNVEIPFAMTADQAMTLALVTSKMKWHEQQKCKFGLPLKFSFLTPTDVVQYTDEDGSKIYVRITKINTDAFLKIEGEQDGGQVVYSSIRKGNSLPPPTSTTPGLVGETRIEVLNSPVMQDANDELGVMVAMAGDSSAWYGAALLLSTDDGVTFAEVYRTEVPATIGDTETDMLAELSAEYPGAQTVRVKVNFPLDSATYESLLNNQNRCFIGDEICQFQTATHLGDNVYELGGLIRGRYNTKPEAWPAGTRFVLLDSAVQFLQAEQWMINRTITFKAVSFGHTEDESIPLEYDFEEALSQREWPPHLVNAVRDGSNNVTVTFIPRPRLGVEIAPRNSKYFAGHKVRFSDGHSAIVQTNTYTRAATPGGVTVAVAGVNTITGDGDFSKETAT